MEAYLCCAWFCILLLLCVPWFTATILIWVYAELYDFSLTGEVDDEDSKIARYLAIVQSVSAVIYLVYITLAIIWLGIIGRPDETCVHCCLVIGLPIFCVLPLAISVLILVSAVQNQVPTGQQVGIATAILTFISTSTCCFFLWWSLCCGSFGKGRRSRYPVPLSYLPGLRSLKRSEEDGENKRETTSDYPPPYSSSSSGGKEEAGGGGGKSNGVSGSKVEGDGDGGEKTAKRSWFGRSSNNS